MYLVQLVMSRRNRKNMQNRLPASVGKVEGFATVCRCAKFAPFTRLPKSASVGTKRQFQHPQHWSSFQTGSRDLFPLEGQYQF